MESTSRYSVYSLTADRIPDWLSDEPFNFDDVHTPPSYLIASLQEAFNEYPYDQEPPTYDHSVGPSSAAVSCHRRSVATESTWDDDDEDDDDEERGDNGESSEAADDDEEDGEQVTSESGGNVVNPRYAGVWSMPSFQQIIEHEESVSTPTASSSSSRSALPPPPLPKDGDSRSRPLPYAPPPPYHLLHLQVLSTELASKGKSAYLDFASSLAALDSQLLLTPFAAFEDVCYQASVDGDTSPAPTRATSPSSQEAYASPQVSKYPSTSTAQAVEDDEETDDDDPMPKSPTQTYAPYGSPPPVIWDPKVEEHSRSRSELPIRMSRSISTPYFLPQPESLSSPVSESGRSNQTKYAQADTMAEVAALFLRGPIQGAQQETVHGFPTRARAEPSKRTRSQSRPRTSNGNGSGPTGVKGLFMRSLNISTYRR